MSKQNKKNPENPEKNSYSKPYQNNNIHPSPEPDIELSSCSMYDCTGLIPSAITDESQIESYESMYPYLPPTVNPDVF